MARRESAIIDQFLMASVGLLVAVLSWSLNNLYNHFASEILRISSALVEESRLRNEIDKRLYILESQRQRDS